ncbi:MAG TPA: DUF885 domain-containing protein [Steroidobacteraceae bacterium]|jgi:uncharacterized protein (DUF885 family)
MRFPMSCARATVAVLVLVAAGCSRQPAAVKAPPPPDPKVTAQAAWSEFAARFIEDYFQSHPFFAAQAGRHEFDGQMPDWSSAGLNKEVERLKHVRSAAQSINPGPLEAAQRFEREYLLSVIDRDLFWLDQARFPFTNPAWYIERLDPDVYLGRNYAPLETRVKGYLGYAQAIPHIATEIRANLHTPMPRSYIERGIAGFGGFAEFYRNDVPKVFASIQDSQTQRDLKEADTAAAKAMDALKAWLISQRSSGTDSFALGPDLYAAMLKQTEQVDVPLADLESIGRADLERNQQALKEACSQFAPNRSIHECIARMNADKPRSGTLEGARAMLKELRAFIVAKQIVTIPGSEEALVAKAPPYNRGNFAYINVPGPYEKGVASTFNISPPDPKWSPKEREEYLPGVATLTFTSVHEVWPGHFLQFLHANRNPSRIASLWVGYAYAEGWAHYCEEMMWEEGYGDGNPEMHVGQLAEALLRDVRFLSSLGMHTHGMTPAQSEKMFLEQAYADPGNARQQAARGTYDPAYLNYTLGKLMIRKVRADWVAMKTAGNPGADPKKYWEAFHDQFLSYGGPPIPLVRKAMVGDTGSLF